MKDRHNATTAERLHLFEIQNRRCPICGEPLLVLHSSDTRHKKVVVDYRLMPSRGGTQDFSNLELVHNACGEQRGRERLSADTAAINP